MMRLSKSLSAACLLSIPTFASSAQAADPTPGTAPAASANASVSLGGPSGVSAAADAGTGDGFWERYRPLPMALELGLYGGLANFSKQHNLQDLNLVQDTQNGHQSLSTGLDLGLRAAFYPLSFLGVEGELGVIPTKTGSDDRSATVWTYRAHLIAQYPGYRLVPFVVLGLGGMTMKSHPDTLGTDSDPEMH